MNKIKIKRRGINARRAFRKLNSAEDLVGKVVEVSDESTLTESEVVGVKVDENEEVTVSMDNGDDVVLTKEESDELLETGEVETMDEDTPESKEFDVTREVVDDEGNVNEVTTTVVDTEEDGAIKTVQLIDSRRGRNSRNYRIMNSDRKTNAFPNTSYVPMSILKAHNYDISNLSEEELTAEIEALNNSQTNEFKIVRVADCDGKKVRKIASVTAPTVDEAIEAVKVKDVKDEIQADGYEELVEELPQETVVINSDIDEDILPEPVKEPTPEETKEETEVETEVKEEDTDPNEEELDRKSNSFKGVSAYVNRKYGIKL